MIRRRTEQERDRMAQLEREHAEQERRLANQVKSETVVHSKT